MKRNRFYVILGLLLCCHMQFRLQAQEKVFADYFDIPMDSPEGTEVTGRIHLERNKDVYTVPIPLGYHFEIVRQTDGLFDIETRYDLSNRIMGVLTVAKGKNTGNRLTSYHLTVALKDGNKLLNKFNIDVRVVQQTLWSIFYKRYTSDTLNNVHLYGGIKYSDEEVATKIAELKNNGWKFKGLEKCYKGRPQDYAAKFNPMDDHLPTNTIEYDWEKVVKQIGGLGYSYATSKVYSPKGDPVKREELKEALFQAILTYTNSVPVEGNELLVDGKPIGKYTGDAFGLLQAHKMAGMQIPTHQWVLTDPLVVPVLHLMPDLLAGMKKQDKTCMEVHNSLIRYLQIFFTEIKDRRAIDNPEGRWGEIQDTIYSAGAWADANLGHRSRTMLALPIIWADYNRPLTYVQYWYSDFYKDKPFKGFSYSPGWSPRGVVADVSRWMTKYNVITHKYIQSGFQPDGTVSHHIANATDAPMTAYGFGWLTDCNIGYAYFKNTKYKIADKYYQFQLDRLLNVYPKLFYKQQMDFLITGRSYLADQRNFVMKTYLGAVKSMLAARNKDTRLIGVEELQEVCRQLEKNTFEYSGTTAYWVNEYLVHRRGTNGGTFYSSLKLKSERTVGAEDFDKKVRKSWHMGYGILQVKVQGEEYSDKVLKNFDWHALPGLTEEWRTDSLPLKGGAQASLPGLNKIAGVLADGKSGMGIYHHLTKEKYSSATAFKSYHFIEDKVIAVGSNINRLRPGQGKDIVTFIDQSALKDALTICLGKEIRVVAPSESVNIVESIEDACWLHQGSKGYVILPEKKLQLLVRTGTEVNITDNEIADNYPNFIIALNHGKEPGQALDNTYRYIQLPNVTVEEMPERVKALLKDMTFTREENIAHAVASKADKTWQYAFFKPGNIKVNDIEVTSNDVAQIILRQEDGQWMLSVNNPMPDAKKQKLTFSTSAKLPEGVYTYHTCGLYSLEGETVTVKWEGKESKVTVELPDSRDEVRYNYQSDLYAATPIVVKLSNP